MTTRKKREGERESDVGLDERRKTRKPRRWKVVLHNDDYTTMDFVIHVLVHHFRKSPPEATHIMLQIHHKGSGVAGIFSREIAETKVVEVTAEAQQKGMPLLVTAERL